MLLNTFAFISIAAVMLGCALAAAVLPRLMHAALMFALSFVALAALYFFLGAEFVGLVQIFVYVGAVAVLIVFTILLTRRDARVDHGFKWTGVLVAIAVFVGLIWAVRATPALAVTMPEQAQLTVRKIGETLMSGYVWPLMGVGVLLTVALLGALILAMDERP